MPLIEHVLKKNYSEVLCTLRFEGNSHKNLYPVHTRYKKKDEKIKQVDILIPKNHAQHICIIIIYSVITVLLHYR